MDKLKCPWGCDQLNERGVCSRCRFKFSWLLERGWKETSSRVYVSKVRNGNTRYLSPTRDYKDCSFRLDSDGNLYGYYHNNQPLSDGMKKWNRKHKILKDSDNRVGWETTNKKKRSSSSHHKKHKREKKARIEESPPTPQELDEVERIENQVEAVDIMSFSFL